MAVAPIFSSATMALETLRNDNYENWSVCVRNYLIANDHWDLIETTDDPPEFDGKDDDFKAWRKKNASALLAIQTFCGQGVLTKIRKIDSAKTAWDELAKMHQPKSLLEFDCVNPAHFDGGACSGVNVGSDITPSVEVDCAKISLPQGVNSKIDGGNLSLLQYPEEQRRASSARFKEQPSLINEDENVEETKEGNEKSYTGVSEGNTSPGIITESNDGNSTPPLSTEDNKSKLPPPEIELVRRQSLTRSKFSKPKSRFGEQPFLIDEVEMVEETKEENQKRYTGIIEGNSSLGETFESDCGNYQKSRFTRSPTTFTGSNFSKTKSRFGEPSKVDGHPLIHAINKGDLNGVKSFIERHPQAKAAKIVSDGSTALHVACHAGQVKIVKELVGRLSAEDLKMKDNAGSTALTIVARNATLINIAECLIKKNEELIEIRNNRGFLPVVCAALRYHKDMTRYLYSVTRDEMVILDDKNGSMLLICCILGNILDVALDVIQKCPEFTTTKNVTGISSPIRALSRVISIFPSGSKLPFWKRLIYSCIHVSLPHYLDEFRVDIHHLGESDKRRIIRQVLDYFRTIGSTLLGISGMKKLYEMKLMHRQALEILCCMSEQISTKELSDLDKAEVRDSVFRAVQYGTVEFIVEMVKSYPLILYVRDQNFNGIFQYAVQYRQEKIFSLLYGLDARKDSLISSVDSQSCTITHLAGLLAPSSRLACISGAPLQMQRELQWYKEVKSVVGSMHDLYFNKEKETPDEVFTKNHKQLVKEGEEWMKQTANSCTVVGALIITVMFTAAFTVPGGNDQNTGYPMFLQKKLFTIFIITDAISLFFSSTSVLMFLAILTSRYAEEDFLKSLPTKLIIGLSTLFISIASMMIAFCAALILMLKGELHTVVPLASLACIPIALFIHLQFPLLLEIFMSTYGPSIFDRKMKSWL